MSKKTIKDKIGFQTAHIFGVVDFLEKKLVKVSLEETDVDIEMVFRDPKRYFKCEFKVNPLAQKPE